jgi:hypothetical protein
MIKDVHINNLNIILNLRLIPFPIRHICVLLPRKQVISEVALMAWKDRESALLAITSFIIHYLGRQARGRFLGQLAEMGVSRQLDPPLW